MALRGDDGMIRRLFWIAVIGALVWYFWPNDTWTGHVYPDEGNLAASTFIGQYPSFKECRSAAINIIDEAGWANATYECGRNCRRHERISDLWVCEDTLR